MPKTTIQMRVEDDLLALIDGEAGSLGQTRTTFILRCVEGAFSAKGGAERAAGKVPVPSAPSPAVPRSVQRPAEPITDLPNAVATLAPCPHPKAQRQTLGYATRCGACGEIVK